MTNQEDVWTIVDEATNRLGAYVQTIMDEINKTEGEGLTGPQTEAVLAHLWSLRNQLTGMATDRSDMLPPAYIPESLPGP